MLRLGSDTRSLALGTSCGGVLLDQDDHTTICNVNFYVF